jgi:hypothetical protein
MHCSLYCIGIKRSFPLMDLVMSASILNPRFTVIGPSYNETYNIVSDSFADSDEDEDDYEEDEEEENDSMNEDRPLFSGPIISLFNLGSRKYSEES